MSGISDTLPFQRLVFPGPQLSPIFPHPRASPKEPGDGDNCCLTTFLGSWCFDFTRGTGVCQEGIWWLGVWGGW